MDLALLFVLPLVGGFAFVTRFTLLRYTTGREESQRLYYRAALWGLIFAFVAGFVHWLVRSSWPGYDAGIDRFAAGTILALLEKDRTAATPPLSAAAVRIREDVAIVCMYAFLVGAATPLWNRVLHLVDWLWVKGIWNRGQVRRSFLAVLNLRAIKDQLERLLAESLVTASPIQVTLSNSKVYVGTVLESLDPSSPAKYFRIQPLMSGHRSSTTGLVDFNTFYDNVLAGLEEEEAQRRAATFQLVIPIDKVVSAAGFDFDAYEQFVLEQGAAAREALAAIVPPAASTGTAPVVERDAATDRRLASDGPATP